MQFNPDFAHLLNKNVTIVTHMKKYPISREDRVKKCKLVTYDSGLYIVSEDVIKPGDTVINLDEEYTGYVRICEDDEDAEFLNSSNGLYQKQIASPFDIGAVFVEGLVNHDHTLLHGDGYTIEEAHPSAIENIIEDGGECYILMDEENEFRKPKKFVGRVLIISKEQYNLATKK